MEQEHEDDLGGFVSFDHLSPGYRNDMALFTAGWIFLEVKKFQLAFSCDFFLMVLPFSEHGTVGQDAAAKRRAQIELERCPVFRWGEGGTFATSGATFSRQTNN